MGLRTLFLLHRIYSPTTVHNSKFLGFKNYPSCQFFFILSLFLFTYKEMKSFIEKQFNNISLISFALFFGFTEFLIIKAKLNPTTLYTKILLKRF